MVLGVVLLTWLPHVGGTHLSFFFISHISLFPPLSLLFLSPARGHAAPSPAPSAGGLRGAGAEADAGRRRGHSRVRPSTPALWRRRRPYSSHTGLPPPGRGRRGGAWPWRGARARRIRRPWPLLPAAVRRGARAAARRCPDGAARQRVELAGLPTSSGARGPCARQCGAGRASARRRGPHALSRPARGGEARARCRSRSPPSG